MYFLSIRKKVIDNNIIGLYYFTMKKEKNIKLCKCGCGEPTNQRRDGTYFDYIKYHHMRGENHPLYGIGHSEKSRKKMSESGKGKIVSDETRKKLSEANKGEKNGFYGKKHTDKSKNKMSKATKGRGKGVPKSEEHKRKISEGNKGKKHTEETKIKLSKAHTGKTLTEEHKKNISKTLNERKPCVGRILSDEHKNKISKSRRGKYTGEDNPMYNKKHTKESKLKMSQTQKKKYGMTEKHPNWDILLNSITPQIRRSYNYVDWRNKILKRDNFTCKKCNKRGGDLHAHHHKKMFFELLRDNNISTFDEAINCKELWDLDNGITLCIDCHKKEHTKKGNK